MHSTLQPGFEFEFFFMVQLQIFPDFTDIFFTPLDSLEHQTNLEFLFKLEIFCNTISKNCSSDWYLILIATLKKENPKRTWNFHRGIGNNKNYSTSGLGFRHLVFGFPVSDMNSVDFHRLFHMIA